MYYKHFTSDEITIYENVNGPRGIGVTDDYIWGIDSSHQLQAYDVNDSSVNYSFNLLEIADYYSLDTGIHWNPFY